MGACFDAQCPRCKRRFGWTGQAKDRPPCPTCGFQVPQATIDHDAAEIDAFRKLLCTRPKDATPTTLYRQRVAAGLTLGQAARLLGVERKLLGDVEWGRVQPSEELYRKMAEVYGVGED